MRLRTRRTILRRLAPALLAAALTPPAPVLAGGFLEAFVVSDDPSPFPGHVLFDLVPIVHDDRCIPVLYSLNTTLDPVPNPLGPDFLSLADAAAAFERAFDAWNDIPTSFIDMRLVGTSQAPDPLVFDTVNELSFRTFTGPQAFAISPSVSLMEDTVLADGTDLDGDGDSDVVAGLASCADADGDGDLERPAGFYAAGTILENDVWFNSDLVRWTVADADADTNFRSVDLAGIAAHEFGHSHGLAHSPTNQVSPADPIAVTMFPFLDASDPFSELATRTPAPEEVGLASLHYPEGTAASGPAALQPGDMAFHAVYGTVSGEVFHGELDAPVVGASVSAVDRGTGAVVGAAYSGTARVSFDPATGQIQPLPGFDSAVHGEYTLPVPAGLYDIWIEPLDGRPVPANAVRPSASFGAALGLLGFGEEAWSLDREGAVEASPAHATPLSVQPGEAISGIDLVTNRTLPIANFGNLNGVGFPFVPAGLHYAVRVPVEQVLEVTGGEPFAVHSADFFTFVANDSDLGVWARAALAAGRVLPDGTAEVDLHPPLAVTEGFVAQELDLSPLAFPDAVGLGARIEQGIANGSIESLFLVLQVPTETPFPGLLGLAPLIGLDTGIFSGGVNDVPIFDLSYVSLDGESFFPEPDINFMFRLVLSELP